MQVPEYEDLTTIRLGRIFENTVATYKYYWFLSILELLVKKGKYRMNIWELAAEMVAFAWYPINYFRLSFGKSDSLYQTILTLQSENNIPINLNINELESVLNDLVEIPRIKSQLNFLQLNVPYRFLRPWIDTSDDRLLMQRSQSFENGCLYRLDKEDGCLYIELNPVWISYLQNNYCVLRDFAFWNLTLFLQVRNPNVPNIPNKLMRCDTRISLGKQHEYWNTIIRNGGEIRCIYTGKKLEINDYDLDHFIPWSFVSHNLLWNLMPADPSINSSKNNKLPDLDRYLPTLAISHQKALRLYLSLGKNSKILEDYLSLGCTPNEISVMNKEHLIECFRKTFVPLNQIALNMGFEPWHYIYQPYGKDR